MNELLWDMQNFVLISTDQYVLQLEVKEIKKYGIKKGKM